MEKLLRMEKICKSFFGVNVLKKIDFDLDYGEVHVLLGQNGAGKSTLIKILSGAYNLDSGSIYLEGRAVGLGGYNPRAAEERGIITIYQSFHVVPHLTVAENLSLHLFTRQRGFIKWKEVKKHASQVLEKMNFNIDPSKKVKNLPVSKKQMLEIAIALSKNAKILIMDEPTAALSGKEVEGLFETIGELKKLRIGIIYISHKLEEISKIGDRVTILRDGEKISTVDPKTTEMSRIISLMIGKELKRKRQYRDMSDSAVVFKVCDLKNSNLSAPVNFSVRRNEILGVTGLVGAGKSELARAIYGADKIDVGNVYLGGNEIHLRSPQEAVSQGFGYLPEDRDSQGLCLNMGVKENLSLALLTKLRRIFFSDRFDKRLAISVVDAIRITVAGLSQQVKYLSGGNKQKVIFGKWLKADCRVLLLDEPTIGIDVGARGEIYELIRDFVRREDRAVVFFSSDMDEILEISDRILVMSKGRIIRELDSQTATKQEIMKYSVLSTGV